MDLTGGLGTDTAIAAASAGSRRVLACERHPVVAALLEDGRRRAVAAGLEPATRIEVHHGDAVDRLRREGDPPALVMIDPMFPPRRKSSALPPKPMQRLRSLLHDAATDVDAEVRDAARRRRTGRRGSNRPEAASGGDRPGHVARATDLRDLDEAPSLVGLGDVGSPGTG